MFEAYKVATRIEAIDATGGTILSIAAQFTKASKEASGFLSTLRSISAELGKTAKGWGAALADDFAKATRAARDYHRETRGSGAPGGGVAAPVAGFSGGGRIPMGMLAVSGGAGVPLRLSGPASGRSRGTKGHGGGGGRGRPAPRPSHSGAGGSRDGHAEEPSDKTSLAEKAPELASKALDVLKESVHAATDEVQATNRLTAMNLGAGTTSSLLATAKKVSEETSGLTFTDAINLTTDIQGITSNAAHTQVLLPGLANMHAGIAAYMGEAQGNAAESQMQVIVKALEVGGLMSDLSPDKATAMEDLFTKSFLASGGRVDPTRFVNTMKRDGSALNSSNVDFMFAMSHLTQDPAGLTGTGVKSAYESIVAGKSKQQIVDEMNRLGLLDSDALQYGTTGHLREITPAAMKDADKFIANPFQFMNENILPAITRKDELDVNDPKDQGKILERLTSLFGDRVGSDLLGPMFLARGQIGAAVKQADGTMGVAALAKMAASSPAGNMSEFQKLKDEMETTVGEDVLPLLNKGLEKLNPLMRDLNTYMGDHSTLTKGLVLLLAGGSALASAAGKIGKIGGGFTAISEALEGGALATSLGAFGTVLEAIAAPVAGVVGSIGLGVAAGAVIGTAINDHVISGTKFGDKLGHAEAWVMAKVFRSKEAQEALDNEAKYDALTNGPAYGKPGAGKVANITVPVTIDGREVGRAVTTYQLGEMYRPQSSTSYLDTSFGVQPTGYTGTK